MEKVMRNEEFKEQPGPLDVSAFFSRPTADRIGYPDPPGAGALPPEVEVLRAVERLEGALRNCRNANEALLLRTEIEQKRASFAQLLEERRPGAPGQDHPL